MKDLDSPLRAAHKKAMFIENVPEDTRLAFKSACARRGKSMRFIIINFMKEFATGKQPTF